jgi:hypothetical protein
MNFKSIPIVALLLVLTLTLAACSSDPAPEATPCPAPEPCPDCPTAAPCPSCPDCPEPEGVLVPFEAEWANSPHNNIQADAFRFWDDADPPEIPETCAKCHSTPGYIAFMGADDSEFGVVEGPAPIGTTVECAACHNDATLQHNSVVFPSGLELTELGDQARCMECHQGRASTVSVNQSITDAVGDELDTVSDNLEFTEIHYYAAGAIRYGTEVKGGYEYDSLAYDPRFDHVEGYQSCISCHDMHTLELKVDECAICHEGVASVEDIQMIRFVGSLNDFNGDGNVEEPIKDEIAGLQELLYQNIQAYAAEVAGTPIVYLSHAYPYFFIDSNADAEVSEDEIDDGNRYNAWTGRLLKAAYNYQVSQKDPGAYAHGGKYIIQLLYDSIADLNDQVANPVDMTSMHRENPGHFAASGESWRHWDEDGEIPANCSKCHSAQGLPTFLSTGGDAYPQPIAGGMNCASCHNDLATFTSYFAAAVEFPSGALATYENPKANLCMICHQGRASTTSINAAIASDDVGDDEISEGLSFIDPHFSPAGATQLGTEVKGAYEYFGQAYNGRFSHVPGYQTCIECHDTHKQEVKVDECSLCHLISSPEELKDIRIFDIDFDGDDDTTTGLAVEIENVEAKLLAAIQGYATEVAGSSIVLNPNFPPHWFIDTNNNGLADAEESIPENNYASWTPRLLRAAYNYTWALKDPGSYAHNGLYMLQVLYDTLQDIGGDVSGMTRPAVTE